MNNTGPEKSKLPQKEEFQWERQQSKLKFSSCIEFMFHFRVELKTEKLTLKKTGVRLVEVSSYVRCKLLRLYVCGEDHYFM